MYCIARLRKDSFSTKLNFNKPIDRNTAVKQTQISNKRIIAVDMLANVMSHEYEHVTL
jgi:hypothetical protein